MYRNVFELRSIDKIRVAQIDNYVYIYVIKYKNAQIDEDKSFALKLPKVIGMKVSDDLRHYWKRSQEEVSRGSRHKGHAFKTFRGQGRLEEDSSVWCGECNHLLKCLQCDDIFHRNCFSIGNAGLFKLKFVLIQETNTCFSIDLHPIILKKNIAFRGLMT